MSGVFHVGDDAYDTFMGRYSVRLAPLFADFAGVHGGRVLDVGAGTGMLTGQLLERGCDVTAAEPSPEFCAALRERYPQVDVHQTPAEQLPYGDGEFEAALAQLVVAFMEDAPRSVREMARAAGTVALCMWGVAEVEMFGAIDRTSKAIGVDRVTDPGARRYRTLEELVELLSPLGEVETGILDVTAPYDDFDDFWSALLAQVGPAGAWVKGLDPEQRERARVEMHAQLGAPDGPFALSGRCYAAKVSTEARSAPVPTSETSTSRSRSTSST